MSNPDARRAAVEVARLEIGKALGRRWTALGLLLEDDKVAMTAAACLAAFEVVLEITALGCDSLEDLKRRRATLGLVLASLGTDTATGDRYLAALYERAKKQARSL